MNDFTSIPSGPQSSALESTHILRRLLLEARKARRLRCEGRLASGSLPAAGLQSRTSEILEASLTGRLPQVVNIAAYLTRVCSLAQQATPIVVTMMSSIAEMPLYSRRARALAVALVEVMHFIQSGVEATHTLVIRVVATSTDEGFVVGLDVTGGYTLVGSAEATRAMLRAAKIVAVLGGSFGRGMQDGRMVFGFTFDRGSAMDGLNRGRFA